VSTQWVLRGDTLAPLIGPGYTDEQVRDTMSATLVAGSNVTITPDDAGDTITIQAATTGAAGIPASTVNAKGDLLVGTADDTVARQAVGSDGQALLANSGVTNGVSWGAPAPAAHNHAASELTSGTLAVARLPVGTTTGTVAAGDDSRFAAVPATTQASSYTLALADAGTVVESTSASAVNVTVPPNSSVAFPVGTVIELCQYGAGQITIVAGAGVTLRTASSLTTRVQYSGASLRKRATNEWVVGGDLT
jgi:hypothetical protein